MKNITGEIADSIKAWLESTEVQSSIKAAQSSEDSGTFEVVITTENVDRYGEVIKLDGWEDEHYLQNPVVLWGHDHNQLIGVTTELFVRDGKKIARGKFAPTEAGQEKRKLYDLGILRATSVGFIEKEREGNLITKAELIEFSFVSVPANPYALSTLVKSGLSIDELVTKGFLTIEEKSEEDEPEQVPEPAAETTETPETTEDPVVEKKIDTRAVVTSAIDQAKALIAALEVLVKDGEPEGSDVPKPVEEAIDEEEKSLKTFTENRKKLQEVATLIGEVLADARQENEAHRKEVSV